MGSASEIAVPEVRHPITGKAKTEREDIVSFAERHGWRSGPSHRYLYHYEHRLHKGRHVLDVSLDPDSKSVMTAKAGVTKPEGYVHLPLPTENIRARVERFIIDQNCTCSPELDEFHDQHADPKCPTHGSEA